jgi:hypothetical protein
MRPDRAHRATALLMATLLVLSSLTMGCSFMFVDGPKPDDARLPGQAPCTTSYAWPIVDTLLAGWFLLNAVLNANKPASSFSSSGDGEVAKSTSVGMGVVLVSLTGVSAGVGFSRVNACQESLADDGLWRPAPPPRRRFVPPPRAPTAPMPAPAPAGEMAPPYSGQPTPAGGAGASGSVAPPPAGTVPGQPAPPAAPTAPAVPPAEQVDDDEAPRPRAKPRSELTLPATEPLLAAMPRLRARTGEPARPTFDGLPRFIHPWALVMSPLQ